MKIAVAGSRGQLGSELCRQLGAEAVPLARPQFDLTDFRGVEDRLRALRPDVVINAAAYTQVDRAEQEPETCFRVNAAAVENLARVCAGLGCVLVQVSTDYVFGADRQRSTPYRETDEPSPVNVYGESKLAGERAAGAWERNFIVRTCGLYAAPEGPLRRGRNFVETMLVLASQRQPLRVVNDQHCSPTYVPHLARAIGSLIATDAYGVYHVTSAGATTWFDFAQTVFLHAGVQADLRPISTAEYGAAAPRPVYSVLDTTKYGALSGAPLPSWQSALACFFG